MHLPACEGLAGVVLEAEGCQRANDSTGSSSDVPEPDTWWLFGSLVPHGRDKNLFTARVGHGQPPGFRSSELCLVLQAYSGMLSCIGRGTCMVLLDLTYERRSDDGLEAPQEDSESYQTRPVLCGGHKRGHQTPENDVDAEVLCCGQALHEISRGKLECEIGHVEDKRELGELVGSDGCVFPKAHDVGIVDQCLVEVLEVVTGP